ncbi:MAG: DUF4157 domain-containing protein [Kofleriaceae bacterium]
MSESARSRGPGGGDGEVGRGAGNDLAPGKVARSPAAPGAGPGKRTAAQDLAPIRSAGKGGGVELPDAVRTTMEASFGVELSAVRVHEDELATELGAQAYTQGTDIHFAPGFYDPSSPQGAALLGHELAHVVQQAQGRVAPIHEVSSGRAINDDAGLEGEADVMGAAAARGQVTASVAGAGGGSAGGIVQRKLKVNPIPSVRHDKLALLGNGTPGHPGLTVGELDGYVATQADWFGEPSLTQPDRDTVWKVLLLLRAGPHMAVALGSLRAAAVAALGGGELLKLKKYAACFDSAAETLQISTPATTMARALQLGQAIIELETFVPTPVLRVVIPESGLIYLVDKGKLPELKKYYQQFKPTLESAEEWEHVEKLLTETVAKYTPLVNWVHDLHIFTTATRMTMLANIGDKSRKRPVMLVLFSASDWNSAFLQASNLEGAILNPKNLAIVVQGATSIANATTAVNTVADSYGQRTRRWDWPTWSMVYSPGRLGQVVIAGHGSDQSVEMASPGTNPKAQADNRYVAYDEAPIDSSNPKANGTELLIDTVLARMDPKDANVVFAGCLVGSHDIPGTTNVSNAATAQANLQAAISAHPNLSDYVRQRMVAAGITGKVHAANGSTTFESFNLDPATGKARLSNADDPDISGTKLEYVKTGIEPEGALRAALECYADPAIGPTKVTAEIRARVKALEKEPGWWHTVTRLGFERCLPPIPADVDVAMMLDVVHRIEAWFFAGWPNMINVQNLANRVTAGEAADVFKGMLTSSWAVADHLKVGVPEAWMQHDPGKAADFMAALTASGLKRETFQPLLARGIVDPLLPTLLPIGAPTKGQMILALTIAVKDGAGMPKPVREFLRAAAGGATTTTFPAALGVGPIIAPTGELSVLENIGLAPASAPAPSSGSDTTEVDANVDANHNNKNETYIEVTPHEATVTATELNVRRRATKSSSVIDRVVMGSVVRVMGQTANGWSFIDHNGKTGFVASKYLTV